MRTLALSLILVVLVALYCRLSFSQDNNLSNSTAESFLHSLPHSRLAVLLLDGNRIDFPHFHALGVAVARSKRRHVRSALAWQHGLVKELLKDKAKFASVVSFLFSFFFS